MAKSMISARDHEIRVLGAKLRRVLGGRCRACGPPRLVIGYLSSEHCWQLASGNSLVLKHLALSAKFLHVGQLSSALCGNHSNGPQFT